MKHSLLGIPIDKESKTDILEKIEKFIRKPADFIHIVSLNPENLVTAQEDESFKRVLVTAQIKLIDGIGIVLAANILNIEVGYRVSGVDMMEALVEMADRVRLRVLLIGGKQNLALDIAKCYQKRYPKAKFLGTIGFLDIKKPQKEEERELFSIVADYKPHLIFAAFGSPEQELWLDRHSNELKGIVGMGVGGAFDYIGGAVPRSPYFLRKLGLEWLFRLIVQPWRWRRQLQLIKFANLVLNEWKKKS